MRNKCVYVIGCIVVETIENHVFKKHPNPLLATVASVALIASLAGGAYFLVTRDFQTATVVYAPLASPSVEPTTDPYEGWLTFTSRKVGISFRYPPDQEVVTEYLDYLQDGTVTYIESDKAAMLIDREENRTYRPHLPIEGSGGNYEIVISQRDDALEVFNRAETPVVDGGSYAEYTLEKRQLGQREAHFYRYVAGESAAYQAVGSVSYGYYVLLSRDKIGNVHFPSQSFGTLRDLEAITASLSLLE